MECPYLVLVDFKELGYKGQQLQDAMTSVNVCPTFLDNAFVDGSSQCSLVRINLACHHDVMKKLLERLAEKFGTADQFGLIR